MAFDNICVAHNLGKSCRCFLVSLKVFFVSNFENVWNCSYWWHKVFLSWVWKLVSALGQAGRDQANTSKRVSQASLVMSHMFLLITRFSHKTPISAVREGSLVSVSVTFLQKGCFLLAARCGSVAVKDAPQPGSYCYCYGCVHCAYVTGLVDKQVCCCHCEPSASLSLYPATPCLIYM